MDKNHLSLLLLSQIIKIEMNHLNETFLLIRRNVVLGVPQTSFLFLINMKKKFIISILSQVELDVCITFNFEGGQGVAPGQFFIFHSQQDQAHGVSL